MIETSEINKDQPLTLIKPIKGFINVNLRELWHYRELLFIFMWRDLKVRYKQTVLGFLWVIFPPLITMIVFTVIFGDFAQISSNNIPYPIFIFSGLIIWNLFSEALTRSSESIVGNQYMIQKIYFPRLMLPLSSILVSSVDFLVQAGILLILMLYYHYFPNIIGMLIFPILILITILFALGVGLIFSALNVKYRDVKYIAPFVVQIGMFLTPVIYPINLAEGIWRDILLLNPLTVVIETARSSLFGSIAINFDLLFLSFILSIIYFVAGLYYFRFVEKDFADLV